MIDMALGKPFKEQVEANLSKLNAQPGFGADSLWLTFYLSGPPEYLQQVSQTLKARGWANVGGWESAFLYPKVQVEKSTEAIVETAEAMRELCAPHNIQILEIDADTSPVVSRSTFVTLYSS